MERLSELDKNLFLVLNDLHAEWLDQPMWYFSNTLLWLPLYGFIAYFIIKDFRREAWIIFAFIALTILLSDQITSSLLKPWVARLRPSRDPSLQDIVHYVGNYRGGLYGFASSHAANTFGVSMFVVLLYRNRRKGMFVLFFWATFVSYTRIYLGVHYPGDIIGGIFVGVLVALICFAGLQFGRQRWRAATAEESLTKE
jgi:undecaprenyl-diphosphatase